MSLSLSSEVEARLREEAAKRDVTPEELATRAIEEYIPDRPALRAFIGMGASTSGRSAADAEEMLAEGFGR
ncbi:MAG: CopG family transcriptional regulator [Actinomycetota bacterium]|nr:CopG family transcriptional regulator [Actinomycetota bacterium]